MKTAAAFAGIFLVVLAARLCHKDVVWVEEAYPIAAALQMLDGKLLYRDFWFDKPPLFPAFYTWFQAAIGWKLRLAGALLVTLSSVSAYVLARRLWGVAEGIWAACLLAFFLTFGIHAAVMAAAPDLLMITPHCLAIYFCVRSDAFRAGVACGVAMLVNPKAAYLLAICGIWQWRQAHWVALGFAAVQAPALGLLYARGALQSYWEQVWAWGFLYSADTPFAHGWREGFTRTLNWCGFQSALIVAAIAARRKLDAFPRLPLAAWLILSLAAVFAGFRFFPRYYFFLLVPMVILAARGFAAMPRVRACALALLLIPLVRFGPRYAQLAMGQPWNDLALHDDAREAARVVKQAHPQSLLVWGYRPEIYAYSRVPAGTPFLDSQPLTGVIADRHLTESRPSAPGLARDNRRRLAASQPAIIVDGLGLLNPALAITNYPDLAPWLAQYQEIGRTRACVIYFLRTPTRP
ncbi:MAG: glycosyltransferase family 39 protein [Acidobacteria bacterium]|nr:glycosyltransferase family 39 protein [Acidobacteriota bacterium]